MICESLNTSLDSFIGIYLLINETILLDIDRLLVDQRYVSTVFMGLFKLTKP